VDTGCGLGSFLGAVAFPSSEVFTAPPFTARTGFHSFAAAFTAFLNFLALVGFTPPPAIYTLGA